MSERLTKLESDVKYHRLIGGAIFSGLIALGYLIWDINSKVTYIAGEHKIISEERRHHE